MPERKRYVGAHVTVSFDGARCIHFAECVKGLPAVFDTAKRPWIQVDEADAELVAEVVRRCPSGALRYELTDGDAESWEGPTVVREVVDGPLVLLGELEITSQDGVVREHRAAICRCGRSANQPYCDNGCRRSGWQSAAPTA